jgi:TP901 family phage tail tape measure protein
MAILADLMVRLGLDASDLDRGARRAADNIDRQLGRVERAGQRTADVGKSMALGISLPLAAVGKSALDTAANFEKGLSLVQAVTGASSDEMDKMADRARELAKVTQFSATEAADAMGFLGMAGLSTGQIIESLPATLDLAAAGQLDLADAADIASNVMSGMGMEASELTRITDAMAKGASIANTSVAQMGSAFAEVAGPANLAGWSVEQAAQAVAVFGDVGIQGEKAGTALASILGDMQNEGSKATKVFGKYGISLMDANGVARDFTDVITDAKKAGLGFSDITEAFGKEHGRKFASTLGLSEERLAELKKEMQETTGSAATMAEVMGDNLRGDMGRLKSAWEEFHLVLMSDSGALDHVRVLVTKLTDAITRVSEALKNGDPKFLKYALAAGAILIAVGPLIWLLGSFITQLTVVAATVMTVIRALAALRFAMLLNPIFLVVAALGALVAAFVWAIKNSESFRGAIGEAVGKLKAIFGKLIDRAKDVKEAFSKDGLGGALAEVRKIFKADGPKLLSALQDIFRDVVQAIADAAPDIIRTVMQIRQALFEAALQLFEVLVKALPIIIPQLIEAISAMIQQLVDVLIMALPLLIEGAVLLLEGLLTAVAIILPLLVEGIVSLISAVIQTLTEAMPFIVESGTQLIDALLAGITEALPILLEFISSDALPTLIETILEFLPVLVEAGVELLLALLEGLISILPDIIDFAVEVVVSLVETAVSMLPTIIDTGVELIEALLEGLVDALPMLIQFVFDMIPTLVKVIIRLLPVIISAGVRIIIALVKGLIKAIPLILLTIILEVIPAIVRGIASGIGSLVSAGWDLMRGLASGIKDGAKNVVKDAAGWVGRQLTNWKGPRRVDLQLLEPAGDWVMEGFANGIERGARNIRTTLRNLGNDVPNMVGDVRTTTRTEFEPQRLIVDVTGTDVRMVEMWRRMMRSEGLDVQATV